MFQRVLQKQASMNKRLSTASAMSDPPHEPPPAAQLPPAAAQLPPQLLTNSHTIVQQLPTKSHTETAV